MWKHRILYALALTGAALFLVLYPLWFSSYLMVTMLMLVPLDLFISLPGMLISRRISHSSSEIMQQGDAESLILTMHSKKQFPVKGVKVRFDVSCEDFSIKQRVFIGSENDSRNEMRIDTSISGVTAIEAKRFWIVSFLGLFCFPVEYKRRISVLVLPAPIKPPQTDALPYGIVLKPKPGGGFSDEFDLRPFKSGDTIRNVHWKVSAKLDSLIIREPLVPMSHSRLIRVMKWNGARERDSILSRLLWVSENLISRDLPHYVSFDANGSYAEITTIKDLHDYLHVVLDKGADSSQYYAAAPIRFAWVYRIDPYE